MEPDRDPETAREELAARVPLGRIGTVEDVAAAAVFLASDEAAFLTGIALPIDGGTSVR
jgi:NAD(P)-dependent dehydrogenase (short-subunit alcohol dehydrogenase family)